MTLMFFLKVVAIWLAIALVAAIVLGKGIKHMTEDGDEDHDDAEENRILNELLRQQSRKIDSMIGEQTIFTPQQEPEVRKRAAG